jgi:apolipoprotein D and lipocalin family protein
MFDNTSSFKMKVVTITVFVITFAILATLITWYIIRKDQISGITPVEKVNLQFYKGKWYEIASIPKSFQKGCINTTATYTLNTDGTINVDNFCNVPDGVDHAMAIAKPNYRNVSIEKSPSEINPEGSGTVVAPARLKVKFQIPSVPFEADYWVVELDPNYQWAVVSSPFLFSDFLWILSRTPEMSEVLYSQIINRLAQRRFPVNKLVKTIHE